MTFFCFLIILSDDVAGVIERGLFFVGEGEFEDHFHAVAADEGGDADHEAGLMVFTVQDGGYGEDAVFVVEDSFAEVGYGGADAKFGASFADDDFHTDLMGTCF